MKQSLNACPISPVGPDSTELEALTPNHFILVEHSVSFPSLTLDESFDHRKRYARAQAYEYAIWQRWQKKYVSSLNKWLANLNRDFPTGDLVWIVDPSSPRGHYTLGRVTALDYGKDNAALSATVKTLPGHLVRPLVKLAQVLASSGGEDVADQILN